MGTEPWKNKLFTSRYKQPPQLMWKNQVFTPIPFFHTYMKWSHNTATPLSISSVNPCINIFNRAVSKVYF